MANYKIQLGVQLDKNAKSQIDEQLKKINVEIGEATLSKKAIESIQSQLSSAKLGITIDTSSIKEAQNEVNKLVDSFKKISKTKPSIGNTSQKQSTNSQANFLADQQKALQQLQKYWKQNSAAAKDYGDEIKTAYENIQNVSNKAELTTANKQWAAMKAQISNESKAFNQANFSADKQKFITDIKKYMNENTKAVNAYGDALKKAETNAKNLANPTELTAARKQFQALKSEISASGMSGLSFGDKLKEEVGKLTSFFSASSLILSGISHLKNGFNELVALDDAMVELKKVTDETDATYKKFYYDANGLAKQLGSTTEEIISQTAAWSQLGYQMQDAINLAKDSSILSTISPEMNIDDATKTLVSTMKAYNIEANDVMDGINSKINIVGNNFASDNKDISEILTRSSAAMAAANNSLDQNIALGVAGK